MHNRCQTAVLSQQRKTQKFSISFLFCVSTEIHTWYYLPYLPPQVWALTDLFISNSSDTQS